MADTVNVTYGGVTKAAQIVTMPGAPTSTGTQTSANSTSITPASDALFQTQVTPSAAAANAITPSTVIGVNALLVKASAGNLYDASMTAGATAGFFLLYNSASVPALGALTPALVLAAVPVVANGSATIGGTQIPDRCSAGIVLLFSTGITTYTAPATPALHIRGKGA